MGSALAWFCLTVSTSIGATPAGERWSGAADTVFLHPATDGSMNNRLVGAITQDRAGFLWIGTQDGLVRWDGYAFRFYRPDPASPGHLANGYIQALHVDKQGTLWIGTGSGGLSRYDPDCDCFVNYPASPNGLSSATVWAIVDDGAGGVWAATNDGLDEVDPQRGVIRRLARRGDGAASLPNDHVTALLRDHTGRLWIGTLGGLVRRDDDASAFVPVLLPEPDRRPDITGLFEDSDGRIWIGTKNGGAYVIRRGAADTVPDPQIFPGTAMDGIQSFAEGRAGEVWIGTYSRGIIIANGATLAARRIRHDPFVPSSLDDDLVWALYRDAAGAIWVGTSRGLSRHDPEQDAVLTLFGGAGRPTGISDPDVGAVLPLRDGGLWLGLGVNGIDFLDPVGGRIGGIHPSPAGTGTAPSPTEVLSFFRAPSGDVYVLARNGLFRMPARSAKLELLSSAVAGLQSAVLLPGDNRLLLGSRSDGLWTLDLGAPGQRSIERYPYSDRLGDPRISVMARGPGSALWIGTMNGLNRLDSATGAVEKIAVGQENSVGIGAPWVSTLAVDRHGQLWVGTLGGGISVLAGGDAKGRPRFHHIGVAEGLPDDAVDMLLEAPSGEIWASTDGGLAVIDPSSFAVRALRQPDGVAITAYWAGSGAVTTNGELAFGGVGGLTIVRPDRLITHDYNPSVVVTDLHVGGKPVPPARINGGATASIAIEPDANSLAVEFSALDFSAPQRNRYAYKLEGYDSDWIATDWAHRVAAYTNLPPGRYVLHVRGSNRNGVWSDTSLSLPIQVHRAWHQTIWFESAEALGALGAVFAYVRARTSFLRRRQRQLEREVEERTAELQSLNTELTGVNARLQETASQRQAVANDLENILNSADIATLFLDGEFNLRFLTPTAKELFGIADSDIGRPFAEFARRFARQNLLADAATVLATLVPITHEIEAENKRSYSCRVLPYRAKDDHVKGVVITFADITLRKQAEDAMRAAKSLAESANLGKSRFLAAASHDLRQPLQTLRLLQGILALKLTDANALQIVDRIGQSLSAMSGMLNTLLDINQLETGVIRPDVVDFPIGELLDKLTTEFAYHAHARELGLRMLPCRLAVRSDPRLLKEMLRNLLSNAVKYTKKGRVLLGCRRRGDKLRIEVWDTGLGIPETQLQAIFEEFHQIDNPTRETSRGLGLGLAIVKRLAELLGHTIDVRSRTGHGSVFAVEVALAPGEVRPAPAAVQREQDEFATVGGLVLVVDDDPDVLESLELLLQAGGYRTVAAQDGEEALAAVAGANCRPDVAILDYNLPGGLTGLQVMARLRATQDHEVPAIILTGEISAETVRKIEEQGCVHRSKPIRAQELTRLISDLLAGRPPQSEDSTLPP